MSQAHHVPIMRYSPKTHKPPGKDGVQPYRPIVGADVGITTQGSEILYRILQPIAVANQEHEIQSTEELL